MDKKICGLCRQYSDYLKCCDNKYSKFYMLSILIVEKSCHLFEYEPDKLKTIKLLLGETNE